MVYLNCFFHVVIVLLLLDYSKLGVVGLVDVLRYLLYDVLNIGFDLNILLDSI